MEQCSLVFEIIMEFIQLTGEIEWITHNIILLISRSEHFILGIMESLALSTLVLELLLLISLITIEDLQLSIQTILGWWTSWVIIIDVIRLLEDSFHSGLSLFDYSKEAIIKGLVILFQNSVQWVNQEVLLLNNLLVTTLLFQEYGGRVWNKAKTLRTLFFFGPSWHGVKNNLIK